MSFIQLNSSVYLKEFNTSDGILNFINYSCSQKPINDDHLGQVDKSWYLTKHQVKHHQCNTRENVSLHYFLLFHLRRHVKNFGFVLHQGEFQTPRNRWKHSAYDLVLASVSRCLELVMKHSPSLLTYDVNYVKVLDETMYNATHSSCKLFKPLKDPLEICDISLPARDL